MLRQKMTIAVTAALLVLGLSTPAAAASGSRAGDDQVSATDIGIQSTWVLWGNYPDRQSCVDGAYYLVGPPWYYYLAYNCRRQANGSYDLWLLDY